MPSTSPVVNLVRHILEKGGIDTERDTRSNVGASRHGNVGGPPPPVGLPTAFIALRLEKPLQPTLILSIWTQNVSSSICLTIWSWLTLAIWAWVSFGRFPPRLFVGFFAACPPPFFAAIAHLQ